MNCLCFVEGPRVKVKVKCAKLWDTIYFKRRDKFQQNITHIFHNKVVLDEQPCLRFQGRGAQIKVTARKSIRVSYCYRQKHPNLSVCVEEWFSLTQDVLVFCRLRQHSAENARRKSVHGGLCTIRHTSADSDARCSRLVAESSV